jgi:hypothetical protein
MSLANVGRERTTRPVGCHIGRHLPLATSTPPPITESDPNFLLALVYLLLGPLFHMPPPVHTDSPMRNHRLLSHHQNIGAVVAKVANTSTLPPPSDRGPSQPHRCRLCLQRRQVDVGGGAQPPHRGEGPTPPFGPTIDTSSDWPCRCSPCTSLPCSASPTPPSSSPPLIQVPLG